MTTRILGYARYRFTHTPYRNALMTRHNHAAGTDRLSEPAPVAGTGWRSIERRLPLLIIVLLAVILAIKLALTHATLTGAAQRGMAARLHGASNQLATLTESGLGGLRTRMRAFARDTAIRGALRRARQGNPALPPGSAEAAAVNAALSRAIAGRPDPDVTAELWTVDGQRIAHVGADLRAGVDIRTGGSDLALPVPHEGLEGLAASDSVQIGALHVADSGVFYWSVAPVLDAGSRVGYLARRYRMDTPSRAEETIRALFGDDVSAYYRNADGSVWTSLSGGIAAAPTRVDSTDAGLIVSRPGVGELLVGETPIENTPLVLTLEFPMRATTAEPSKTIVQLGLISLLLTIVGGIAAWGSAVASPARSFR